MIRPFILFSSCFLILFSGCRSENGSEPGESNEKKSDKPLIIAVSYPLEYLTQRIAGDAFEVRCPVPANQSASEWKPGRNDIQTMQSAELVVANGRGARFAKWLELASIPANKVLNSAYKGLSLTDFIEIEDVVYTHSHGDGPVHSHPTNCAYTWLHPEMALKQSKFIHEELARRYPDQAEAFAGRFAALSNDLNELKAEFDKMAPSADTEKATVLTANPELKFLTRACNWNDVHLKWFTAPDADTFKSELKEKLDKVSTETLVKRSDKTLMISTYEFPGELKTLLEENEITVVVIDKLDVRPTQGDYLSVMKESIAKLRE